MAQQQDAPWLAKVVVLVVVGGALAYAIAHHGDEAKAAAPKPTSSTCLLTVRSAQAGPYVFPTKEGLEEWDAAVMTHAGTEELKLVLLRNRVTQADWRSTCEVLDSGISHSKVRVTSGAIAGTVGWVPTSQTLGD